MLCPANILGYLLTIRSAAWARRRHSERRLPVFPLSSGAPFATVPADAAEESLFDLTGGNIQEILWNHAVGRARTP